MKTFMVVHKAPKLSWDMVEENWRKLARIESATWIKTYYNVDEGLRYCLWQAPETATLEKIFGDLAISFYSITEVEETRPDMWGKEEWEEHIKAEEMADTLGV